MSRSNTADLILDQAETLIQTRGYSAFSYQDVAQALGVTKASLHYHFPSKSDLGVAVIERYAARMAAEIERISADPDVTSMTLLEFYATPYLAFAETPDRICLSAALAGEVLALPTAVRQSVSAFFRSHQDWLAGILARGHARGEFVLPAEAPAMAQMIFGALQGALMVKRTTGDLSQVSNVLAALKAQLSATTRSSS